MKYLMFLFCLTSFIYAMEQSDQFCKEFEKTIGKVLAKEKIIQEDSKKKESIEWYRKNLKGHSTSDIQNLMNIRELISFENIGEYDKESVQLVKFWFDNNPSYLKDETVKQKYINMFLELACDKVHPELISFFLKLTKEKNSLLFYNVVDGYDNYHRNAFLEKDNERREKAGRIFLSLAFKSLKKIYRAGVDPESCDCKSNPKGDIHNEDHQCETPFLYTTLVYAPELVAFFLAAGADPMKKDNADPDREDNEEKKSVLEIFNQEKQEANEIYYHNAIKQIEHLFERYTAWNNFLKHPAHQNNFYFSLLPKELLSLFEQKFLYGVKV